MDESTTMSHDEMKSKLASYITNATPDKITALYTLVKQDIELASTDAGDDYEKLAEEFLAWDGGEEPSHSWEQVKKEGMELLKSIRDNKD